MKTGKELILDLPNGVRRNFILQLAREEGYKKGTEFLNEKYKGLNSVIGAGIVWAKSPQGQSYWEEIQANVKV